MSPLKRVFWVSTIASVKNRQSFISRGLIEIIKNDIEVVIFTPERDFERTSATMSVKSLFLLPNYCELFSDFIIVYNLEDTRSNNLISFFAQQYPGIVLLHDLKFFNLEMSRISHGSTASELNQKMIEKYGSDSSGLGTQFALGKSLEIFSYNYDFLKENIGSLNQYLTFGDATKEFLSKKAIQAEAIPMKFQQGTQKPVLKENYKTSVLIFKRSSLSRVGRDLTLLCPQTKATTFLISLRNDQTDYEIIPLDNGRVDSLKQWFQFYKIRAVIEVGTHPLEGLSSFSLAGLEEGKIVYTEQSLETKLIKDRNIYIYEKSTGLSSLIKHLLTEGQNQRSLTVNYEEMGKAILAFCTRQFEPIMRQFNTKKTARLNFLRDLTNKKAPSNLDNAAFDLLKSYSYPDQSFDLLNDIISR